MSVDDLMESNSMRWKRFFQERASRTDIDGYRVNGFIDSVLVDTIHNSVRKLLTRYRYEIVFDCGCGDGSVTSPLTFFGIKVFGLDFSPLMCLRAERQGLIPIESDLTTLQNHDLFDYCGHSSRQPYGCILFCESLGCIDNPLLFLSSLLRSNAESTDLIIAFPNGGALIRLVASLFDVLKIKYFDLSALTKVVSRHSSLSPRNILAIVSVPFVCSFTLDVSECNLFVGLLLRLVASNYVVRYSSGV